MKKFFLSVVLFLPFAAIVYVAGIIIWGSLLPSSLQKNLNYRIGSYGHMYSRMQDVKKIRPVDVLFLGSSHAYRGFDTRLFESHGLRSFNMGSSAQTPVQTRLLLKKYLDRLSPKLIVYEVYPGTFSSDGVESALDLIANDRIDYATVEMALDLNHMKVYNTLVYGLYKQVFGLTKRFKEPVHRGKDYYIQGGGFVERSLAYNTGIRKYPAGNWVLNAQQLAAFDDLLHLIRQKKIPYMLVYAPVTSGLYKSKRNGADIDRMFQRKGMYVNFNEIMTLNDTLHFYDPHHLNQDGVKLFNEKCIALINDSIPSLRGHTANQDEKTN